MPVRLAHMNSWNVKKRIKKEKLKKDFCDFTWKIYKGKILWVSEWEKV